MAFFRDLNDDKPTEKPEVLDIDSIKQSILDLLLTSEGEVPFNPDYGMSLPDYLFELEPDVAEFEIMNKISSKLDRYYDVVTIDTINSSAVSSPDIGKLDLDLHFIVEGVSNGGFALQVTI